MEINKEDLQKLSYNDRIELLIRTELSQGKYINQSILTGTLIILTVITVLISTLLAIILWGICIFKVVKDKKKFNRELSELVLEYFTIKPRSNK